MKLDEWVFAARKHGKLTQAQLGKMLNVTKSNVSAWENGRHEPSYAQLQTIAAKTNYPLNPPPKPDYSGQREQMTESEWMMIEDSRVIPTDEQEALRHDLHQRAEKYRGYMRMVLDRAGKKK